jgi:hypothetical protein
MKYSSRILLGLFLLSLIISSCTGSHEVCPAYTKADVKKEVKG